MSSNLRKNGRLLLLLVLMTTIVLTVAGTMAAAATLSSTGMVAVLVPHTIAPASAQPQGSSDFAFEYTRSGGIAGISEKIAFGATTLDVPGNGNDGKNIIKFYRDGKVVEERRLSEAALEIVRQEILDSQFFDLQGSYPPKETGVADYFLYTLSVALDNKTHSVSWVDDFASSVPVPEALGNIVATIQKEYDSAPVEVDDDDGGNMPPAPGGKRRIVATTVLESIQHDAEGHQSHQAAYVLPLQQGQVYRGALTFSSTRPVDIMAYHDVTDFLRDNSSDSADRLRGIGIHVVGGRSYAVTTLLKNSTAGTVEVVGSTVLAHTAGGEPFALVATVDALKKTASRNPQAGGALFTIDVSGERFALRATDPATVQQLKDSYEGKVEGMHVTGRLVRGDGGFNQPWSWHLAPDSVRMAEVSIELCDGRPSMVEADLGYWLDVVGDFCPWSSKVVDSITG